jgi:hypothetical protein
MALFKVRSAYADDLQEATLYADTLYEDTHYCYTYYEYHFRPQVSKLSSRNRCHPGGERCHP